MEQNAATITLPAKPLLGFPVYIIADGSAASLHCHHLCRLERNVIVSHNRWIVRVGDKYLDADSHPTISRRDRAFAFSDIRANAAANLWVDARVEPQEDYKVNRPRGPY